LPSSSRCSVEVFPDLKGITTIIRLLQMKVLVQNMQSFSF
jgi:hypothetical protein